MNRGASLTLAAAVIAAAVGAAVLLARDPAPTAQGDSGGVSGESPSNATGSGLAQSASKVAVSSHWITGSGDGAAGRVRLVLEIADGWHVNANPASLDFLIATRVTASANGDPIEISPRYPAGKASDIELEGTRIRVYGDGTVIPVDFPPASLRTVRANGPLRLTVRVQSCSDDGTCLAPSDLHLTAASPEDS